MTPDWLHDAIFYEIFPDRFATSARVEKPANLEAWDAPPTPHGFKGGDLLGVIERLDYLQTLGVNAIYFTPVFQSAANHRYHTHDYFQIDPLLGGNAAFRALLDAAHARGIRVILDGVFNHASRGFYQFNHVLENGAASPYVDWFQFKEFPVRAYDIDAPNYAAWWNLPALPKFNHTNPRVREFLLRVAEYWIEQGIDGWRLDVPGEIDDDDFWREFRRRVKAINPDAYVVGEIWHRADRWLRGDMFDGVMNYQFTRAALAFFADLDGEARQLIHGHSYGDIQPLDAPAFANALQEMLAWYPREIAPAQMNLLDSHDTARFLSIARGNASALRLAWLVMFTYIGVPTLYYGDEIGMLGARDPDNRRGMIWDEEKWDKRLRDKVISYCVLRRRYVALRRGDLRVLFASGQTLAYARQFESETIVVALNAAGMPVTFDLPVNGLLQDAARVREEWSNEESVVRAGHLWRIELPARGAKVWTNIG
ncbi:MAG: alpha-glucosidase C-terminal domain-containing protein [Chloroflexi bacterium]|nr:alpha-glucosidase C-terminal domain-containing protein [Chloroflexota bacterium]